MLLTAFSSARSTLAKWCFFFSALPVVVHAAPFTISDNLFASTAFTETVQGQTWVGAPFRTTTAASLTSVSLLLGESSPGVAVLSLYSGSAQPETLVGALKAPASYTPQLSVATFTGNGLTLAAVGSYWIVLQASSGQYQWAFTEELTGLGPGFTPGWGITDNAGAKWFTAQSEPMQMQVLAETVPEPGSMILVFLGLVLSCALPRAAYGWSRGRFALLPLIAIGAVLLPHPIKAATTRLAISVLSPRTGELVSTATAPVTLLLDPSVNVSTFKARLNDKAVTSKFLRSGHCRADGCPYTATLSSADGLRTGQNMFWVQAVNSSGNTDALHMRFDWRYGLQLGDTDPVLTPLQGFTTIGPGGGSPNGWIQIYSNQGRGSTTVYPKGPACTTTYQVLALNRSDLKPKQDDNYVDGYQCFDDDASLTAALNAFTVSNPGQYLVIAGTTPGKNALPRLNTSAIGGTDYTAKFASNAANLPITYMVVGVSGSSSAGLAYENASTAEIQTNPDDLARANGLLTFDKYSRYTFHSSDYVEFRVRPYQAGGGSPSIQVGDANYNPPANNSVIRGGFWLLILDRRNLFSIPGCAASETVPNLWINCGTYYATNDDALDSAAKATADLAAALKGATQNQLLFLVALGQPKGFDSFPSVALANSINNLGGSGYTLGRFSETINDQFTKQPTYTLISSNDDGFAAALTGSAIVSTNIGDRAGLASAQTGFVKGVLGRDHNGLFRPLTGSQETIDTIDDVNSSGDFSGYKIFWSQPTPWPLMDTDSQVGAYKWLSYGLVLKALGNSATGRHLDDVRWYYPGDLGPNFSRQDPTQLTFPNEVASLSWTDPVDNQVYVISEDDRKLVAAQLGNELSALASAISFFGDSPATGTRGALLNNGGILNAMFSAMAAVQNTDLQPDSSKQLKLLAAGKWLKLAGTFASIGTVINPAFGVVGGLLNSASAVTALLGGTTAAATTDIPGAFAEYETTLSSFIAHESDYHDSLQDGMSIIADNVYSDWSKLQRVGRNAANTESKSWYFTNQVVLSSLSDPATKGAARYFYLQLISGIYGVDFWSALPVSDINLVGTYYAECYSLGHCNAACYAFYSINHAAVHYSYDSFPTPGTSSQYDLVFVGGALSNAPDGTPREVLPPPALLDTLFNPSGYLALPRDLFFSPNGPLARRTGPTYVQGGVPGGTCVIPAQ